MTIFLYYRTHPHPISIEVLVCLLIFESFYYLFGWTLEVYSIQLEQSNKARDQFLASLSHEIRTPMVRYVCKSDQMSKITLVKFGVGSNFPFFRTGLLACHHY